MKTHKGVTFTISAALAMALLILDSKTAIEGARTGLDICLRTVIPSLFPFVFLSSLLTSALQNSHLGQSRWLCRLFQIPLGADGILLTGLLGGYPVGAKCIGEAVICGQLSQRDGERMLAFCNAAGPAFLFGICSSIFPQKWVPWLLWAIHLFSALCVARLLPGRCSPFTPKSNKRNTTITQKLRRSIQVMAEICSWIILMRIVLSIFDRWWLWYLPSWFQVFIGGILELSNGCISLVNIENSGLRFTFCAVFLGFGGICVAMQTRSAAVGLKQHIYLYGKMIQALISFLVAYVVQGIAFEEDQKLILSWLFPVCILLTLGVSIYYLLRNKKSTGILETVSV